MFLSVKRLPSPWVCAVTVCFCAAAAGRDVTSGQLRSLMEAPQLFDSCFEAYFLFTVEMTPPALAPLNNTDITRPPWECVLMTRAPRFLSCAPNHSHSRDRLSVSNTNLLFTKAPWDSCSLHLHSE